ncbi:MAG: SEC-C domain-containing protein [Pseudomonadota bacterium]
MSNKIWRNQLCPCGSGKKYKHCCGRIDDSPHEIPLEVQKKLYEMQEQKRLREINYGKAKEIVHADFHGHKIIAVGNEIHWNKCWETFPDFLGDYIRGVLDHDWGNSELKKPLKDRHEILKWYDSVCRYQSKFEANSNGVRQAQPTGAMKAWFQLAYDLYTIRHNAELQDFLLGRIRSSDQFQGALYEANVTAIFIRAGYDIDFEDETDRTSKHPEFIATHRVTGNKIAVEAKSRHRPGILGQPGAIDDSVDVSVDAKRILNKAFAKQSDLPFIVFLNVNVPPTKESYVDSRWIREAEQVVSAKSRRASEENPFPASAIIFTNAPYYWQLNEVVEDYGWAYGRFIEHPVVALPEKKIVQDLVIASRQNGNIPNEFPDR